VSLCATADKTRCKCYQRRVLFTPSRTRVPKLWQCNQVAQTESSLPCTTLFYEPLRPFLYGSALSCVRAPGVHKFEPQSTLPEGSTGKAVMYCRGWEAFAHVNIVGEYKANVNKFLQNLACSKMRTLWSCSAEDELARI
jgi:hypothetical protein